MFVTKFLKAALFVGFLSLCLIIITYNHEKENIAKNRMVVHEAQQEDLTIVEGPPRYVSQNRGTSKKEHDRKVQEKMEALAKAQAKQKWDSRFGSQCFFLFVKMSNFIFLFCESMLQESLRSGIERHR